MLGAGHDVCNTEKMRHTHQCRQRHMVVLGALEHSPDTDKASDHVS